MNAIGGNGETVPYGPHALAPRAFGLESGPGPRADQGALVLRGTVHDGAHESVGWRIAVARSIGRDYACARAIRCTLDSSRQHHIPRDSIALRDDKQTDPVLSHTHQGRGERGAFLDGRNAAHALIRVPSHDPYVLPGSPRSDRRALGFGPEALLVLADSDVG
jgi:hypothetical protein